MSSLGLNGKAGLLIMCMDDRHKFDYAISQVKEGFPELQRVFLLTSPGGKYSYEYTRAVKTVLLAGYELVHVIHAGHDSCAAKAVKTRTKLPVAYALARRRDERLAVNPDHHVAHILLETGKIARLEPVQESLLPAAATT
jgi:hypothetical protein